MTVLKWYDFNTDQPFIGMEDDDGAPLTIFSSENQPKLDYSYIGMGHD